MEQNKIDSMYAAYRLEIENVHTVFIDDIGFANYKFEENNSIYVQEVFVQSNIRGLKYAAKLTDMCIKDAEDNCDHKIKTIYTTVAPTGKAADKSLRAITDYGFKVLKTDNELIYFYKEINNE